MIPLRFLQRKEYFVVQDWNTHVECLGNYEGFAWLPNPAAELLLLKKKSFTLMLTNDKTHLPTLNMAKTSVGFLVPVHMVLRVCLCLCLPFRFSAEGVKSEL